MWMNVMENKNIMGKQMLHLYDFGRLFSDLKLQYFGPHIKSALTLDHPYSEHRMILEIRHLQATLCAVC